mgnify:CR=1 FL=1
MGFYMVCKGLIYRSTFNAIVLLHLSMVVVKVTLWLAWVYFKIFTVSVLGILTLVLSIFWDSFIEFTLFVFSIYSLIIN